MIKHIDLGDSPFARSRQLKIMIDRGEVNLGGNIKLKIYGSMNCASGKKMKPINRIFFNSEAEALEAGYRPCGHCMRGAYQKWKNPAS